jgi:hypothetical protein
MTAKRRLKKQYRLRKAPFFIIFFFLFCMAIGIAADEPMRVLEQAVRVCLSCIGIG